ncbi:MAG TPA: hypothetical protein VIW22_02055 [Nitrososphaerales archaeon]
MSNSDDEKEVKELSEIYDTLRSDAKQIIHDLKGGVMMWREAASANVAIAGFVAVWAITSITYGPGGLEGYAFGFAWIIVVAVSTYYAVSGFKKYFRLRKRYAELFAKARKLE